MPTKACDVCGTASASEFCEVCGSRMPAAGDGAQAQSVNSPPLPPPAPRSEDKSTDPATAHSGQAQSVSSPPLPPPAPTPKAKSTDPATAYGAKAKSISPSARPLGSTPNSKSAGPATASRPAAVLTSYPARNRGLVVGAIAVGVVVLVVWAVVANQPPAPTAQPASRTSVAAQTTTTTRVATGQNPQTAPASTGLQTNSGQTTEDLAREELNQEVQSYTVTTDNHYLVELAAKWVGATDPQLTAANGSHTFYASDILAEYRSLKSSYGLSVHLVLSAQFGKQSVNSKIPAGEPLYITIYDPGTFAGKSDADSWCSAQFPGLTGASLQNVCLTHPATPPHN